MAQIDINTIIEHLRTLSLKNALVYISTTIGAVNFLRPRYIKVKEYIKDRFNEKQFAFVPNKEEAEKLKNFSKLPEYKQFKKLVPHYKHIDLIRTGLLIKHYHERNHIGDKDKVLAIKCNIARRRNGRKLKKIATFAATPFSEVILNYLWSLEGKYSPSTIEEIFEEIIDDWESSTMLVRNKDAITNIENFCIKQMEQDKFQFFLLGMLAASKKIRKVIDNLNKRREFSKYQYKYAANESTLGNQPRLEVTFYKKD